MMTALVPAMAREHKEVMELLLKNGVKSSNKYIGLRPTLGRKEWVRGTGEATAEENCGAH